MLCKKCYGDNDDGAAACRFCGNPLEAGQVPAPAQSESDALYARDYTTGQQAPQQQQSQDYYNSSHQQQGYYAEDQYYQQPQEQQPPAEEQQQPAASPPPKSPEAPKKEDYQWDNFMKYLEQQPPPPEKPKSGVCSQCKSKGLQFLDDGRGQCPDCGRQFWWDKTRKPRDEYPEAVERTPGQGSSSYYSPEYTKQVMERFLEENLPKDTDLALLEQMRRLGVLYREQRMSWADFKEKMDGLKEEFKA